MAVKFIMLCDEGDLEGVQAALQNGVDVNSKDLSFGQTGLMMALRQGHTAVVNLLLGQEGIDVNISDCLDQTALHQAAQDGQNSECLSLLLARGDLTASVNQKDWAGQTPLLLAVECNATICVQLLISDKRIDPNIKDDRMGITPLMLAVKSNHVDCVKLLISDNRTNLNSDSPLMLAVEMNHVECLQPLLSDNRIDPNIKSGCGGSTLMLAVERNRVDCLKLLLSDKRTDPNIKDDYSRNLSLMNAVRMNHVNCVKLLMSCKRTHPNIKDDDGNSPLMLAVKWNYVGCMELLLGDPRVDLMTRDNYERTGEEAAR